MMGCGLQAKPLYSRLIPTDLVEDGQPVRLEVVYAEPDGEGPFPTVVFNHGSTGNGSDPSRFTITTGFLTIVDYFNERGWLVVFPQRRGRGKSDGLYDEGFTLDRSGYSCDPVLSLPGVERAMEDIDEVMKYLRRDPVVKPGNMLIGGQSRGGILSIAYAGTRPGVFRGVINFVGGWMSDGCPDPEAINTVTFIRGADFVNETLWLYGRSDPFYSVSHSLANFNAFKAAGGTGQIKLYTPLPGYNGHGIIFTPSLWESDLTAYLTSLPRAPEPAVPDITSVEMALPGEVQVRFTAESGFRYWLFGGETPDPSTWSHLGEPVFPQSGEALQSLPISRQTSVFFTVRAD
ncbi:MAG: alpha/beta hydrolase family protein [Puniceicoccaceae bacterium]